MENTYTLVVTSLAATDTAEQLQFLLRREGTADRWQDPDPKATLSVPSAVIRRCGHLGRHPDDRPDVEHGQQREAAPALVTDDIEHASIDDIGAWLWDSLPQRIRTELTRCLADTVTLRVEAKGTASVLPWHRMSAWAGYATHRPGSTGRWHIVMQVDGGIAPSVPVQRRVLLLVGSQRQRPEADDTKYSVIATVKAIRDAGFHCEVAAGRAAIVGFDQKLGKWHELKGTDHVMRLIADKDHRFDIVHYMGHSDATRLRSQSPLGASQLEFEFEGDDKPRPLAIVDFAKALRTARTPLVVLHACLTRELVAYSLLHGPDGVPGAVHTVLTMGAIADPEVCATFSAAFYQQLQPASDVATGLYVATRELRTKHPGLDWLPLLWTGGDGPLRIAGEREVRLAKYNTWVRNTHCAFLGPVFGEETDALDKIALDLELSRERAATDPGKSYQDVLKQRSDGRPLRFCDLLAQPGWWTLGGEPGSGKTTTLRRHARELAKDRALRLVPIYLPLASWLAAVAADLKDITKGPRDWFYGYLERLSKVPGVAADLEALAGENRLVVLLDGLDELPPELRTLLTKDDGQGVLTLLRAELESCSLVVGTRRYQSAKRLKQEWFGNANLLPLSGSDAVGLLHTICAQHSDTGTEATRHRKWFEERLAKGERLWVEVARTPLLVSLLALQLRAGQQPASSRLAFFERTFEVLCRGLHRAESTPLPHHQDALRVLRYLAFRLTVSKTRSVRRSDLLSWLEGGDADATLRPTKEVVVALGDRAKWLPEVPQTFDAEPSTAEAFLHRVAADTLILGPEDTSPTAAWRFWHKSFQEALCALHLHERFVVGRPDEREATAAMLAALDVWIGGGEPSDAEVARHRLEVESTWRAADTSPTHYMPAQSDIIAEAQSAPTDDPVARNRRLQESGRVKVDAVIDEVARSRARQEPQEALLETLVLLTDRLVDLRPLLGGLLQRSWVLAQHVAMFGNHVPPDSLAPLLAALPELGQRVAVIEAAAAHAPPQQRKGLLVAIEARARTLLPALQQGQPRVDKDDVKRRVWDAPGELFVLREACAALGVDTKSTVRQALLGLLPTPDRTSLQKLLTSVPGRELEFERGRTAAGVRMWRFVPAGPFVMGTSGGGPRGDEARHTASIARPFWISAVTVTVALYRLFSPQHEVWTEDGYRRVDDPALDPATAVGCVSHHAARMFCVWLQHHAGEFLLGHLGTQAVGDRLPAFDAIRVRLPQEVEWECAARAGSETEFFFGDEQSRLENYGWFDKPGGAPHPVALLRGEPGAPAQAPCAGANALGLFDVHGNVWEWCSDWYGPSAASPPRSGRFRVLRGGSFRDVADFCRSAFRFRNQPDWSDVDFGFRLVVSAPELDP